MPTEIRWFVRTSLVCLVLSAAVGTLAFAWPPLFHAAPPPWIRPMHTHLATVGWLVNMVFGVALWMFPLPWGVTSERRYNRTLVGVAWIGINGGLALRFAGDILANVPIQILSGVLQTGGILLCVSALWPRIRTLAPKPSA
ncbi:MAG: hypothetical protein HYY18_11190 [Planctomycetes bacterium]|nr:hypothetical protein [Planctomycetota bacterium]